MGSEKGVIGIEEIICIEVTTCMKEETQESMVKVCILQVVPVDPLSVDSLL